MPASTPTSLKLSRSVPEKRLALYGFAAGAALAAGASPAQAVLITLDLTGEPLANRTTNGTTLYFDVNAASAAAAFSTSSFAGADFRIDNPSPPFATIVGLAPGNAIAGYQAQYFKASQLASSHNVGPGDNFGASAKIIPGGDFAPDDTGFLGLRFAIGADTHYGWANITTNSGGTVTLNALGYESLPDTEAHTEMPSTGPSVPDQGSTLALLAIGAAGLVAFRGAQRRTA
ncbi:MAG TPA: VPDSG-CTERM sorting domain-containing protein [Chthoniobacterales bacterium]|nr:VPDSG-CTERM sorting domain-containing protein [Chthoniobacterales bacterium]